jgi:hypothetical protein
MFLTHAVGLMGRELPIHSADPGRGVPERGLANSRAFAYYLANDLLGAASRRSR